MQAHWLSPQRHLKEATLISGAAFQLPGACIHKQFARSLAMKSMCGFRVDGQPILTYAAHNEKFLAEKSNWTVSGRICG